MPRAIITTVHPFDAGLMVGSHHVARVLARRGWDVLLLTDPASSMHTLAAPLHGGARARVKSASDGLQSVAPGLKTLTPITLMPLSRQFGANSSFALRTWPQFTWPSLKAVLEKHGFHSPDLLMFDGAVYAPLRALVTPRKTVLRLFDWPDGAVTLPPALRRAEIALARVADAVAVTSEALADVAHQWGAKTVLPLKNGVDAEHFLAPQQCPAIYSGIQRPRIVYMGAIAPWIDQDLMQSAAQIMSDCQFVWIGPGQLSSAAQLPNVHAIGPISYHALPGFLQHADAAVIPFDVKRHGALVDHVNPLKYYEYAAAGLPVVATATAELRRIGGPVLLADGVTDFVSALRASLNERVDKQVLRAFALEHGWDARVQEFLQGLGLVADQRP